MHADAPIDILLKRGIDPAMRYSEALKFQKKALKLAYETNNINTEAGQWENLSKIYAKQKNFEEALKSYQMHTKLSDSIAGDKKGTR